MSVRLAGSWQNVCVCWKNESQRTDHQKDVGITVCAGQGMIGILWVPDSLQKANWLGQPQFMENFVCQNVKDKESAETRVAQKKWV